ncbi:MAG: alpha-amylase [Candidatus Bathyarchaeia archaeon]
MPDICFCFEAHQPYRLNSNFDKDLVKNKSIEELFNIYFDNEWNKRILRRVCEKCYIPATELILENIDKFKREKKRFKVAFSFSGVLIEQLDKWMPNILDLFKQLVETGCVELLNQTYYHSLSSLFPVKQEFIEQILLHRTLIKNMFNYEPKVFENTEFLYNNSIAKTLEEIGFKGVFTEGVEKILIWRSPNFIYKAKNTNLLLLLRNSRLSDDIAFRFSVRDWIEWPLTADKYAAWLSATPGQCVNIFIDYETFGEHQWKETGIFEFLKWLPTEVIKYENLEFKTPSELMNFHKPVDEIDVPEFNTISWADTERSTNAWLGNNMQKTCFNGLIKLEPYVKKTMKKDIVNLWRLLQISDHFYYMYAQPDASGIVHSYFSQQPPVKAFWTFMKVLSSFYEKVAESLNEPEKNYLKFLRVVPPNEAFHFYEDGNYINLSAYTLEEFKNALLLASNYSILFHVACKHFEKWIKNVIGDYELAYKLSKIEGNSVEELKNNLYNCINERLAHLTLNLKKFYKNKREK